LAEVANLEVLIGLKDNLTKGLTTAQKTLQGFGGGMAGVGKGMQVVGDKMSSFGSSLTANFAPLTGLVTAGLEAAAGFEGIMTQLETFGGLTGDALDAVRQKALDVGAATMFSASDAANAMLELTKAGFSVQESMAAVDGAMTLAAIGEMGVADAAGIVSSTLAQFGLDADDAGFAVDTLAAAANASRASVQSIADGLANVGPIAAQAGLDLTETSAALAVLSNVGIDGAEAGTKLKSMLLNFQGDTAAEAFDKLGVSLYTAEGNTRNLDDVLDELAISLADKTPEEQADLMKQLAGSYGITALSALLAAGGIDGMISEMDKAPDAASLAEAAMGTFNGKVESLKGSVETLMIEALTPLMDNVLGPLVTKVTEVVNAITDWATKNPEAASAIGGVILAIGALGVGLTVVGGLISGFGMLIGALGTGITILTSPIALLAGAIALLVAVLNDPGIQAGLSAWQGVFDMFGTIADAIGQDIGRKLNDVASGIRSFFRDIEETINRIQIAGADVQMGLGINWDANAASRESAIANINAIDMAKGLETTLNDQIMAGGGINLDPSQYTNVDYAALASKITDPVLIQDALSSALAENDQAAIDVLLPLATELGIDTQSLIDQYQTKIDEAATAMTYDATATVNLTLEVGNVNANAVQTAIATTGGVSGVSGGAPVNGAADGANINSEGLLYVHPGEKVLNAADTEKYDNGGRGGNPVVININGVQDVDAMRFEILRRGGVDILNPTAA